IGAGTLSLLLAVLNFPLFVIWLASLIIGLIPGIGQVVLPLTTKLVRARADLERRRAAKRGVVIARPYPPRPTQSSPGGWRRFGGILQGPATWRDFAWLLPGGIVTVVLSAMTLVLPIYSFEGILLIPLWVWLGGVWYGYGAIWPIESIGDGFLS